MANLIPFRRRTPATPRGRVVVASARRLDVGDRKEAMQTRALRQGWQNEAWAYHDAIGEIRYAQTFRANALARCRYYPAIVEDPHEAPVPLLDSTVPGAKQWAAAAEDDLARLSGGTLDMSALVLTQTVNANVAGEYFLVGLPEDPATGEESWTIRSLDELVINGDGEYFLRDRPAGFNGYEMPPVPLGDDVFVSRIWTPHPRFGAMASSEMRGVLEACEELLLASRMIRATLRSRIAGAGLLLVPEELELLGINPTDDEAMANPFFEELTKAMVTPIQSEGDASEVVPVTIKGPADVLKELRHITLDRPIDEHTMALRQELLGRIATGIDLPPEVLTGKADLNHWSAWNVSDDTFRHHLEPAAQSNMRGLAAGYGRPMLLSRGVAPELARRLVYGVDPSNLVTHPDRSTDAFKLHDDLVLSDDGLLRACGFDPDKDKPSADEFLIRLLSHSRTMPPNIIEALFHKYAPGLEIPADKNEPGYRDGIEIAPVGDPAADPITAPPAEPPAAPPSGDAPAITAAGVPSRRVTVASARLAQIDRDLRARLLAASDAALRRQLEKAGARLRSKLAKTPPLRAAAADIPQTHVAATLGREALTQAGIDPSVLVDGDFADLAGQWDVWVPAAQNQALTHARKIAPIPDRAAQQAADTFSAGAAAGKALLTAGLTKRANELLFNPDPQTPDQGEYLAGVLVGMSLIRAAVAVAGGFGGGSSSGLGGDYQPVDASERLGGVGTGVVITDTLTDAGAQVESWTWNHGGTDRPLDSHEALDGASYLEHDDPVLANPSDWPEVEYLFAGDHDGCTCDEEPTWLAPGGDSGDSSDSGDSGEPDLGLAASADPVTAPSTGR